MTLEGTPYTQNGTHPFGYQFSLRAKTRHDEMKEVKKWRKKKKRSFSSPPLEK